MLFNVKILTKKLNKLNVNMKKNKDNKQLIMKNIWLKSNRFINNKEAVVKYFDLILIKKNYYLNFFFYIFFLR